MDERRICYSQVNMSYGRTVNWNVIAGRDFSPRFGSDLSVMILNEAAVRYMGLQHPVEQIVDWWDRKYHILE